MKKKKTIEVTLLKKGCYCTLLDTHNKHNVKGGKAEQVVLKGQDKSEGVLGTDEVCVL